MKIFFLTLTLRWPYDQAICPSVKVWTIINLHHILILKCNFGDNLPSGSWEEDFSATTTFLYTFLIISICFRATPFILVWKKVLGPRMLCAKFYKNWPWGSWDMAHISKNLCTPLAMPYIALALWAFGSEELKINNQRWKIEIQ